MTSDNNGVLPAWPDLIEKIRARTPARVLVDRAGAAYATATQLELREAHAAARDAVRTELNMEKDFSAEFIAAWKLFEVATQARSKDEYLLRPDMGRSLTEDAARTIQARCPEEPDLQIVIGDGLSFTPVTAQPPKFLPLTAQGAKDRGWELGQTFVVQYCRVGIINHVGALLRPRVVV